MPGGELWARWMTSGHSPFFLHPQVLGHVPITWWRCQHLGQTAEEGLWLLQEMDRWGCTPINPSIRSCFHKEVEGDGLAEAVGWTLSCGLSTACRPWAGRADPVVRVWPQAKLLCRWEWAKLSKKHLHSKNNFVLPDPSKCKILRQTTLLFPSSLESKAQALRTCNHVCLQCDSEYQVIPVWDQPRWELQAVTKCPNCSKALVCLVRLCHYSGYGIRVRVSCADGSSALSKGFKDQEVCMEALQVMVASNAWKR